MPENDGVVRDHWTKRSKFCMNPDCRIRFSVTVRKHHCRKCGKVREIATKREHARARARARDLRACRERERERETHTQTNKHTHVSRRRLPRADLCRPQLFCGRCTKYRLTLDPKTLAVDFKSGNDCRVCKSCYNKERQWSKRDLDESKKNRSRAMALAEENERLESEVDTLRDDLDATTEEKVELERKLAELEGHLLSTALCAQVHKRKIRSDSSTTPWKERLVVASPAGIRYYKAQQSIGKVDLKSLSLVTGCIQSKHSSPVKGKSSTGLQMITKDGTIYEFSMPNGEQNVTLWQKHVDFLMRGDKAASEASALPSPRASRSDSAAAEEDDHPDHLAARPVLRQVPKNAFKMGWLNKKPGKTGFWQKRWFVVSDGLMAYYRSKSIVNPIQQLSLANSEARQIMVQGKTPWCLQLYVPTSNRLFVMEAPSSEELAAWLSALKAGAAYAKTLNLDEGQASASGAAPAASAVRESGKNVSSDESVPEESDSDLTETGDELEDGEEDEEEDEEAS